MANVKIAYINSTGGYLQSTATADVVQSVGKIELTGVSGVALDANGAKLSNVGSPSSSTDVATKSYVDALAQGLSWTTPVVAVATSAATLSGTQTVDGISLSNGDRVLITGQNGTTADAANGIYVVSTSGAWARASGVTDTLQSGTAVFVKSGTEYADTQWVLSTDGSITPGTTPIMFVLSGGGVVAYTAGSGITITSLTIAAKGDGTKAIVVDASAGIQLKYDTNYGVTVDSSAGLRINLDTNSGLEFNSGPLRIDVANTDQLSLGASGISVTGVPSLFKINGTATSADVTAANLGTLTGGGFTTLHGHQGIAFQGTVGTGGVTAGNPVYFDASGNVLPAAANSATTAGVVGIALVTMAAGFPTAVQTHGECAFFTGLTAGTAYYLGDTAGTVEAYADLSQNARAIRLGYAKNATTIILNIQDMGEKP